MPSDLRLQDCEQTNILGSLARVDVKTHFCVRIDDPNHRFLKSHSALVEFQRLVDGDSSRTTRWEGRAREPYRTVGHYDLRRIHHGDPSNKKDSLIVYPRTLSDWQNLVLSLTREGCFTRKS